jgi:hypothetical protein
MKEMRLSAAKLAEIAGSGGAEAARTAGRIAGHALFEAVRPRGDVDAAGFWTAAAGRAQEWDLGRLEWVGIEGPTATVRLDGPTGLPDGSARLAFAEGLIEGLLGPLAGEPVSALAEAPSPAGAADGDETLQVRFGAPELVAHLRAAAGRPSAAEAR